MKTIKHGLPSSYTNHRCRCAVCRDTWRKYYLKYNRKYRAIEKPKVCSVEGCNVVSNFTSSRKGMCYHHYHVYKKQNEKVGLS